MKRKNITKESIDELEQKEYKDIYVPLLVIKPEDYERLANFFMQSNTLESILISYSGSSERILNDFFKFLVKDTGELNIDPKKLILRGETIKDLNCDFFKYIENIAIGYHNIKNIDEILARFPNLKKIECESLNVREGVIELDICGDFMNLFKYANFFGSVELGKELDKTQLMQFIAEHPELQGKFVISRNGSCLLNLEKIERKQLESLDIVMRPEDLQQFDIENLRNTGNRFILMIDNTNKLSVQDVQELKKLNIPISIEVYSPDNMSYQNEPYELEIYEQIRMQLDELVEGIDINLPEKERFAEIYRRIGQGIVYDVVAAYPSNKDEDKYEEREVTNCRNLKNGLLKRKCVCAGYADILRNALAMVGIESRYVSGKASDEAHAWNKVKLDGEWYNTDITWDATKIRLGRVPEHCLKTDEQICRDEKKTEFIGPICNTEISEKEIDTLFGGNHKYIGNFRVPKVSDIIGTVKETAENFVIIGSSIKGSFLDFLESMKKFLQNDETKLLQENNFYENTSKSWELENWGVNKKEFSKETENVVCKTGNTSPNKNKDEENFTK